MEPHASSARKLFSSPLSSLSFQSGLCRAGWVAREMGGVFKIDWRLAFEARPRSTHSFICSVMSSSPCPMPGTSEMLGIQEVRRPGLCREEDACREGSESKQSLEGAAGTLWEVAGSGTGSLLARSRPLLLLAFAISPAKARSRHTTRTPDSETVTVTKGFPQESITHSLSAP